MDHRLRVSIDSLREGVQLIDSSWRYLYLNAAAVAQGQRPHAELLGRTMMECYPGIEHTELFTALQRVMDTRRPEVFTNEFAYPTGERRWFELVIDPVPDGICVLSLDVTERNTKQAEVRRLESELHRQRLQVFRATMRTVEDIVNNFLNGLQLVRQEAQDDRLSAETLTIFDEITTEAAEKLKRLSAQQQVREKEMAIGLGIDYEDTHS